MQPNRFFRAVVFIMVLAGVLWIPTTSGAPQALPSSSVPAAFSDFTHRVEEYVKLRDTASRQRTTKQRKEIVHRRQALGQNIRETRPNAKPGDIFTPAISKEFRRMIQSAFQGSNARNVRRTIRQGEPVAGWKLTVNGDYPEHLPLTTIPPTLLLCLPQLPSKVAYRIIGHDLVLQDTEARLVVDFIPGAIP